ncbi:hypothetical protein [Catellatospora sp. NPDC049609]|uniref:hypothetical protein n=1 Tax=Catellatospora sp. NPDC049609 TaxID=3155505 RepID=UPI00342ECE2E
MTRDAGAGGAGPADDPGPPVERARAAWLRYLDHVPESEPDPEGLELLDRAVVALVEAAGVPPAVRDDDPELMYALGQAHLDRYLLRGGRAPYDELSDLDVAAASFQEILRQVELEPPARLELTEMIADMLGERDHAPGRRAAPWAPDEGRRAALGPHRSG